MHLHTIMIGVFFVCSVAGTLNAAGGEGLDLAAKRPNILLAISDDQSWPHAGAYGDQSVRTPAFDQLARNGVLFTHAFCPASQCSPSRASLLTGRNIWQLEEASIHVNGRRQINGQDVWVCQTVFPWEEDDTTKVVGRTVRRILKPFKLSISGRTTSGTGDISLDSGKPATLAFRFFPLKTVRGDVIPNQYMIAFDVVPVRGSHANSDFNDYVLYACNIRPLNGQPEISSTPASIIRPASPSTTSTRSPETPTTR